MDDADFAWMRQHPFPVIETAITKALGTVLKETRRARGLSHKRVVERMADKISERTLGSYEVGRRHMTVVRLLEVCMASNASMLTVLGQTAVRARQLVEGEASAATPPSGVAPR